MSPVDLVIVAAGNGTRMGDKYKPKILTEINGVPNLYNTFNKIIGSEVVFKNIYIVTNKRNWDDVSRAVQTYDSKDSLLSQVSVIEIESGRGDGHAILEMAKVVNDLSQQFFIMWGDAYLTSGDIFDDCLREAELIPFTPLIIPVINEIKPYVTFLVDANMNCISADFSKHGENHPSGFHDQCVFLVNHKPHILNQLYEMEKFFFKNGRYITESGENTFLYIVHALYNTREISDCDGSEFHYAAKAIITDSPVLSYNTLGEVKDIERVLRDG